MKKEESRSESRMRMALDQSLEEQSLANWILSAIVDSISALQKRDGSERWRLNWNWSGLGFWSLNWNDFGGFCV